MVNEHQTTENAEKRAKRFWIALVVFLFAVQGTIMGAVMHLAIGDPSAAVVPDYHNAALNWDQARHKLEAAERLNWELSFSASDVADARGMRAIELTITDQTDTPVNDLTVAGKIYHHARAGEARAVTLDSVGNGKYITLAPAGRVGLWQLELAIDGGPEPLAKSVTFYAEAE